MSEKNEVKIRNQLYIGKIFVTDGTKEKGYYVKGIHEGLIPESLFNQVQENLEENLKQKRFVKAKCFKEEFLLRGIIKCENCGANLTGSASRSKNGVRHQYYHCNHCHEVRMRVNEINSRIESILNEIKIGTPAKKIYNLMIRKILMQDNKIRQRPDARIQMDIAQCEARIRKLEDSYADESIDLEMLNNGLKR